MNKRGPIICVEDDEDDQEILNSIFKELQLENKIVMLGNGDEAYHYLNKNDVDPFLIISDVNMPLMNGIELRDKLQREADSKLRSIPFLFLTTGVVQDNVKGAYSHSIQGFFRKPASFSEFKTTIEKIINYWFECMEPSFN